MTGPALMGSALPLEIFRGEPEAMRTWSALSARRTRMQAGMG
jgi:hypothetical protein